MPHRSPRQTVNNGGQTARRQRWRRVSTPWCVWVAVVALVLGAGGIASARAAQPDAPPGYRVLVFSRTLGFRHANIPLGVEAIKQLGTTNGFAVDATEESAAFTSTNLNRYRAVVLLSVTGDVFNEEQQEALKGYLLGGGGLAAIHGALFGPGACEEQWPWYGDVCCVAFKNHSKVVPAKVTIADPANPSTAGIKSPWLRTDEWYNFNASPRGRARVLVTIDESTYAGGTLGADHPLSWCRKVRQGRFWYTAMGHTDESFQEPDFLRHVLGGIEQVAGVKQADFDVPAAELPRN